MLIPLHDKPIFYTLVPITLLLQKEILVEHQKKCMRKF